MTQEEYYRKAQALRQSQDWAGALNALNDCLAQGPYPPAVAAKEAIEEILNTRFVDWMNV